MSEIEDYQKAIEKSGYSLENFQIERYSSGSVGFPKNAVRISHSLPDFQVSCAFYGTYLENYQAALRAVVALLSPESEDDARD